MIVNNKVITPTLVVILCCFVFLQPESTLATLVDVVDVVVAAVAVAAVAAVVAVAAVAAVEVVLNDPNVEC